MAFNSSEHAHTRTHTRTLTCQILLAVAFLCSAAIIDAVIVCRKLFTFARAAKQMSATAAAAVLLYICACACACVCACVCVPDTEHLSLRNTRRS